MGDDSAKGGIIGYESRPKDQGRWKVGLSFFMATFHAVPKKRTLVTSANLYVIWCILTEYSFEITSKTFLFNLLELMQVYGSTKHVINVLYEPYITYSEQC